MNKKGLSFFSLVIILFALTVGLAVTSQTNFNVEKFNSNIQWKNVQFNLTDSPEIGNALSYYINGLGAAFFEVAKWITKWAAQNPTIPYKLLIYAVLISILSPIIYYGFLIIVVVILLIKEWLAKRKEDKFLRKQKNETKIK